MMLGRGRFDPVGRMCVQSAPLCPRALVVVASLTQEGQLGRPGLTQQIEQID